MAIISYERGWLSIMCTNLLIVQSMELEQLSLLRVGWAWKKAMAELIGPATTMNEPTK